jgi:hypothetical protein
MRDSRETIEGQRAHDDNAGRLPTSLNGLKRKILCPSEIGQYLKAPDFGTTGTWGKVKGCLT